jgi:hypothetical protein
METSNRHIILRQRLDIELAAYTELDRHALAEEFSRLGRILIPGMLDTILSAEAGPDEFKYIDKLELVLELEHWNKVEDSLRRQLPELFKKALLDNAEKNRTRRPSGAPTGPSHWLFHFLENGSLPWNAPENLSPEEGREWLNVNLLPDNTLVGKLRELLLRNEQALIRFMRHFGWTTCQQLLQVLEPKFDENWPRNQIKHQLVFKNDPSAKQLEAWRRLLRQPAMRPEELKLHRQRKEKNEEAIHKTFPGTEQDSEQTESLFVSDAGMILMHPFLPRLLVILGWVKDQQPSSEKAASLLHFLAWRSKPVAEWDLILPKILLGVPLSQSVQVVELDDNIIKEGEKMLKALIQHWSVLKNTSIEGLQESFLQRPGRITQKMGHWQLKVDQRPFDLLLDQIPWNIQVIRLPWMTQPLYVEWV